MRSPTVCPSEPNTNRVHRARYRGGMFLLSLLAWAWGCAGHSAPGASTTSAMGASTADAPPAVHASSAERQHPHSDGLLPNARTPRPGLLTGGEPTGEQLERMSQAGYGVVISLLPDATAEGQAVAALGMEFVSIPVSGPKDLTEEKAQTLHKVLEQYANVPVALHCASGNRAGALLSLAAFYGEGQSKEAALALGEAAGLTSLKPAVTAQLGLAEPTGNP